MKKYIFAFGFATLAFAGVALAQSTTFTTDLSVGSTGQDVVNLQTWLIANGFDIPAISSGAANKGFFGSQTKNAVAAYQRSVSLPAFGYFGRLTRAKVNAGGGSRGDSLRITSPNGGETWQIGTTRSINWTTSPGLANQTADIRLEFQMPACAEPTAPVRCMIAVRAPVTIAKSLSLNSGSYSWVVGSFQNTADVTTGDCGPSWALSKVCISSANFVPEGRYKVQICPTNGSQCDESDDYFTLSRTPAPVTVTSPNGGETFVLGGTYPITWTYSGSSTNVSISLKDDSKYCPPGILGCWTSYGIGQVPANVGTYSWNTNMKMAGDGGPNSQPVTVGTKYRIVICDDANNCDSSDSTFTIAASSSTAAGPLRVTSPNGGETLKQGTTQTITWTSPYYLVATTVDLKLVKYGTPCADQTKPCPLMALAPYTIALGVNANANQYQWTVGKVLASLPPTNTGSYMSVPDGQYTIMVCEAGGGACDSSDGPFTVTTSL